MSEAVQMPEFVLEFGALALYKQIVCFFHQIATRYTR